MFVQNESMTASRLPIQFTCDNPGCYWTTGHKTIEDAERVEAQHLANTCPLKGIKPVDKNEQPTTPVLHGRSVSEKIWEELDAIIAAIKIHDPMRTEIDMFRLQGKAQGIAFSLAKLQFNYYPDEQAVLRQAQRRWKMDQKLIEWEPTLGYKYNPPPPGTLAKNSPAPKSSTARKPATPRSRLSPERQQAIINGRAGGMTDEDMASIFLVSLEEVRAIQS